ncbi:MAG: DUF3617 domain-containing protein [Wenzhouxiangellaceae bacterium]
MNLKSIMMVALGTALAGPVAAEDPNINPGMWETTSTVTLESAQFSMPPRTETNSECLTAEKIAEGQAFLEDNDDCEFSNKDLRPDGMDYTMTCNSPDGGTVKMNATMNFDGDTMTGTVDGSMESPMGEMTMKVELSGQRTGDC